MPRGGTGWVPVGRLGPDAKIRKRREYLHVQGHARRVNTPCFVLLVMARPGEPTGARLGVTVSRRVGNAVVRNRAKRLVREAFRATRALWEPDVDLVVIVRRDLGDARLSAVISEWVEASRTIRRRTLEARKDRDQPPTVAPGSSPPQRSR